MLSDKVFCGHCSLAMSTLKKSNEYYCSKEVSYGIDRCFDELISIPELKSVILEEVKRVLGEFLNGNANLKSGKSDKFKLERRLKSLKQKKVELYEKYADGIFEVGRYLDDKFKTEQEILRLEKELNTHNDNTVLYEKRDGEELLSKIKWLYTADELTTEHTVLVDKVIVYGDGEYEVGFKKGDVIAVICGDWGFGDLISD